MRKRSFLGWLAGSVAVGPALGADAPVRIAAASDLKFALTELAHQYQRATDWHRRIAAGFGD